MRKARSISLGLIVCILMLCAGALSAEYSWQKPHAKVIKTGDLEWTPEPFEFEPRGEVRYIDFKGGDDDAPGTSKDAAWKHHPWDPYAAGKARAGDGADTYVFKGGVTYRGKLEVPPGASAHLTRDPSWGRGGARIYGSDRITAGWRKGAHPEMPGGQTVWRTDLDFAPRNAWLVQEDKITRLKLARTPNWEVSDPDNVLSEWWEWDQPEWWKQFSGDNPNLMSVGGKKFHLGIDRDKLGDIGQVAVGGYVWTEYGFPTGNFPYPAKVHAYDEQKKGLAFGGPWFEGPGAMIFAGHRYYLEDRPQYLDEPGEFWFDRRGEGGTLYVRLPGDADPNTVAIEAARRTRVINAGVVDDLRVSGLTFRFTNVLWDLGTVQFGDPEVRTGVVRVRGGAGRLIVDHCRFEHVHLPLRVETGQGQTTRFVAFNDNVVRNADDGACDIADNMKTRSHGERGELVQVRVMRNRVEKVALRGSRGRYSGGLRVNCAALTEAAGNVVHRCGVQGIDIYGCKRSGETHDAPLSRVLVHHNKVLDPILMSSDWGGIETWQGGPFYVFNNISANPGGLMWWQHKQDKKTGTPRFGFAFYTDGAFKNYHFNNISWGKNNTPGSPYANSAMFQSLIGFLNTKFNNTAYKFIQGSHRQGLAGSRFQRYLGNIFQDIAQRVFAHANPPKEEDPNAPHFAGGSDFEFSTMAYARNILHEIGVVGVLEEGGKPLEKVELAAEVLQRYGAMATQVGQVSESAPLRDPEGRDFRPAPDGGAVDGGVRTFVPWGLYGMVGEWHFTMNRQNPAEVPDEHWYMTEAHSIRNDYYKLPRYPLMGHGITAHHFADGPLEDWTIGALRLNGRDQYLSLSHEELVSPITVTVGKGKNKREKTFAGDQRRTVNMHENNFLIEAYFRAEPGASGVLCQKMGDAGYALTIAEEGNARFTVRAAGEAASATSQTAMADGRWHHVIAEADREDGRLTLYVDGKRDVTEDGIRAGAALSNEEDFFVGGTPDGRNLAGTIEFLRVAQGTLADAHTTIEELYEWQFNGPFLRDFCGNEPDGKRDAGAIELKH